MRFAAISALSGCALIASGLAGCTALLDTGSLSNGHGADGADNGGTDTNADAGSGDSAGSSVVGAGGEATSGAAGNAQGGDVGSGASAGNANVGGGGTGAGGASAGAPSAGAAGAPCTKTHGGKEICDGIDNDCNPATPDCPAGCTAFSALGMNYMACAKLDTWSSAEIACLEQTMQLAQILSATENEAVSAELKELKLGAYVWIGGESDTENNATFEWIDATVIYKNGKAVAGVYQNFASGQPASLGAPSDLQIDASTGTWSSALPSTNQAFVCKNFSFQ